MPEKKKKAVVPRLRFPEFRDAGPWEVKKISEIFRVTRGQVLATSLISEHPSTETPYPVYSSQTKNDGLLGYYSDFLYQDSITWTTDGANAGDVKFRKGKFYCTNVCGVLINEEGYANTFIAELLNSVTQKYVSYVGNPKLMNGVMAQIEIPLPKIEEQQRIADCLSSLDDLIRAEEARLEALQAHKKGLMQQLFPREGETTPRLRFPEFRNAGPWEVKRLGEISEVVRGGSPRPISQFLTDKKEGLNWLKIGDILDGAKYVVATQEKIKPSGLTKTREVVPGDLILSNSMSFGRPYIMRIRACIHDGWLAITSISELQTNEFLYYFIMSVPAQQYLHDAAAGGGVRNLNADIVKLLPVPIPGEPKEQQKIADCLSSLDDLIRAQGERIEALKQHKKGLMQQLFPQEVA